jgi:regulator-associated protein of mTOR
VGNQLLDCFVYLILAIGASFMLTMLALYVLEHDLYLLLLFQSASQVRSGHFAAGFADGSVRIFDVRSPDR